jgi:hypothetical protein
MDIEISIGKGVHSITSDSILCCNETGRVIAVFYNDYDLLSIQAELETLRAENAKLIAERDEMHKKLEAQDDHCKVLSMHIDDLKADNSKILKDKEFENITLNSMVDRYQFERDSLLAERETMQKWHDAILHECMMTEACYVESDPLQSVKNLVSWHVEAEREAMMKQEPVGFIDATENDLTQEYFVEFYPDKAFKVGDKVFLNPLPAQQIPEGYALVPIEPTRMMAEAMEYEAAGFAFPEPYWQNILAAASASQPKGDV